MTRKMYDSVNPNAIPANAEMVAGYIDGGAGRWAESAWNRFPHATKVRIARRVNTNDGHVLDVESGIPTVWPINSSIVDWVLMRRKAGVEPTIYCNEMNDWRPLKDLFRKEGVREPLWWVARYNNIPEIPHGAIARQYANAPLAGGHYDLSVVANYWPGVDGQLQEEVMGTADVQITKVFENSEAQIGRKGVEFNNVILDIYNAAQSARMAAEECRDMLTKLTGDGLTLTADGQIVIKPSPVSSQD